jgi:hypothetical protein
VVEELPINVQNFEPRISMVRSGLECEKLSSCTDVSATPMGRDEVFLSSALARLCLRGWGTGMARARKKYVQV